MNIQIKGMVDEISEAKYLEDQKHGFVVIWIKTYDNSSVAINCWNEKIEATKKLKIGDIVNLDCRIESHKNKKRPNLFFHKILLS